MRAVEKRLRERIKGLEKELAEVKADRDEFRKYWAGKFRWYLELHGKGTQPNVAWLIEDMAKFFTKVQRWYWS